MPLYDKGLAIFITGFGGKTELMAVKVDGQGDVTDTHVVWRTDKSVSKTASPVIVDGLLYMVADDGMVTCLEVETANRSGAKEFRNYSASPIYADGRIYFCNQQSKTFVLKAGRTFELISTNSLDIGCMASPAVSDKSIYLRTKTHLYRISE